MISLTPRPTGRAFPMVAGLIALCLIALGLLAACGGGSGNTGGKTTIRFANWADAEDATRPGIEALIKKFEASHPNIVIKSEPVSFTDIEHQMLLQVQSGNAPDVAELAGNYTFTVAATRTLQPLEQLAGAQYQQSIIPDELKLGEVGGQLVAVPWTVGPVGLWYNKKLMKDAGLDAAKPPATWNDLLSALRAVHQKNPKAIALGLDSTNRPFALDTNWPIIKSFGGQPFQGKTATANSPGMTAYLAFMRQIATSGYTPPNQKAGFFRQPAASGQVAFTIDGPYLKSVVQATSKVSDKQFFDTWGVAPLPSASGQHFSVPTDHQLVMFKTTKKRQAAWEFMKFLTTSPDGLQYTINDEGSLPPLSSPGGELAKQLDNPVAAAFRNEVIPTLTRPEWGTAYAKAYSPVMSGIQSAMTSSTPIGQVAATMQSTLSAGLG